VRERAKTPVLQAALRRQNRFGRLTIEGLLDLIEQARGSADKLVVEYDPHYGFPASLEVDYSPFIADDEFSYRLTDFQAY